MSEGSTVELLSSPSSNNNTTNSGTMENLDQLRHQSSATKKRNARTAIDENLRRAARRESFIRRTTITFKKSSSTPEELIVQVISQDWINNNKRADVTFWFDRSNVYVQFISLEEKLVFISWLQEAKEVGQVRFAMKPRNKDGTHYKRRPVRLIFPKVRSAVKTERISRTLKHIMNSDCNLSAPLEGIENPKTKLRCITFSANSNAFKKIFIDMNGWLPYLNGNARFRAQLTFKINCRPMTCKKCHTIGVHTCRGKICSDCAGRGHQATSCSSTTKFCINCQKKGHGAIDSSCPIYSWALTKELFKMDFPLEFYEDANLRDQLVHALLLK